MRRPGLPAGPWVVVGLARSGQAAGRLLHARGESVLGVDTGSPALPADLPFEVRLGDDGVAALAGAGAVAISPGVPLRAAVRHAAAARGLPVLGELELAWRLLGNRVVGVTGTNGKTTVTAWLAHVLREAGLPVAAAGNVGTALSGLVGTVEDAATLVVEASSYQLHDAPCFTPDIGLLLNLGSDHLDWHGTLAHYQEAKRRILRAPVHFGPGTEGLPEVAEVGLPGAHNRANARFVAAAAGALGVAPEAIATGLRTFPGVEHRLEEVAVRDGVRYVNDSKATNVESALTALQAFGEAPLHVILGGDDAKAEDFAPLREPVARHAASVHLIGQAAGRLRAALGRGDLDGDLEHAVAAARALARAGEVVLLAPGCASFDQFTDFEARGQAFKELVG